ncbi:MAG: ATP synthase F1 subunit epsilon [Acutalibacteraceae bacterium]|nr:ATP synthase F1 subunit epsilon [Acutalibacteraceae bacterium]
MSEFLLEIITPEKHFFKGTVEQITCQTEEGELGILKGHQTMVASLEIGEIKIKARGEWKSAFISEGFMEVRNDEVIIFSQCCEWPEEIDGIRAEESLRRALDKIEHAQNIKEHRHNEISLARAMARLKIKKQSR